MDATEIRKKETTASPELDVTATAFRVCSIASRNTRKHSGNRNPRPSNL